jgi:hypothetical protein
MPKLNGAPKTGSDESVDISSNSCNTTSKTGESICMLKKIEREHRT